NPNLHYPGDYNVAVRGHRDLAYREEVLEMHGVTMQVVTLTTPGTHVAAPATLPLNDPKASLTEFERATNQLGLRGAMLFSNVNGIALSDERFWPIYEAANDRAAVLYIHPAHPVNVDMMREYWL